MLLSNASSNANYLGHLSLKRRLYLFEFVMALQQNGQYKLREEMALNIKKLFPPEHPEPSFPDRKLKMDQELPHDCTHKRKKQHRDLFLTKKQLKDEKQIEKKNHQLAPWRLIF